jgi:hypothetical protein
VPQDAVQSEGGWVRMISVGVGSPRTNTRLSGGAHATGSSAEWTLRFSHGPPHRILILRLRSQSVEHALSVGIPTYDPPTASHEGGIETDVALKPYRPLGVLPPRILPGIPGWAALMTLVTAGAYFGFRWSVGHPSKASVL